MKQKNILKIIVLTILFFTTLSTFAQLATYPLTADGVATGVNANITASDFTSTGVSGFDVTSSGGSASNWSLAEIDLGEYFEITLTPNAGYTMNITAINFGERRSGTGPRDYQVRWSVDDFSNSTTIATVNVPDNTSERDGSISGLDIDVAVGETLKIRWYGYNAEGTGGTWRINDGTLNVVGTTTLSSTPTISFDTATSSVNETNATFTTTIPVSMINYAAPVTVSVTVNGASTAEPADYTLNTNSLNFNANETLNVSLDINPDADIDHETVILDIAVTVGTATIAISQHTLTILDDEAPNVEDFTNSNATSSYADGSFLGNYGITWTYVASRDENSDANGSGIDGKALMLRRASDNSSVTSSTIAGGIQNFSVKLYKGFTGAGNRQVEVFINSVSYGTSVIFDDFNENIFTINNINITGNFTIEIRNIQSGQIIVDDITWSNFSPETVTWDGSESTDWATAANWDTNEVPTAGDNVVIADVTNKPVISSSTNAETNDLTINGSATLTISNNGTLRVFGTSSGNVTYNRNLGTENWYLVSSPVSGETYDDAFVAANSLAINGTNNAIGSYTTADNTWSYMQTGGGATFTAGTGYSVRRATSAGAGNISFTGTINTSDVSFAALTGYNLLGNPFTSYLNGVSFINGNSANIDGSQIWVWNQANGNYDVKNLVTTIDLAPAQGFFVNTTGSATVNMAKSYQQSTGSAFQKTAKTEVQLLMTDGTNNRYAKVFYLDNGTTGFDNGYDGETFGGIQNSFDVFTHLVANSEGKKYQVQSLPNSDFENMVVPVGIKAAAGKEITFSAEAMNIPDGINVYLEDRTANTVTLLSEANATYKVTLTESLDGIGRFYLHTKASGVLSTTEVALDNISIYSPAKSTLRIAGVSQGKASVKIYSVLGKQVFANTYNTTGVIDMNLPTLTTGLYVVQLETEKGTLNKKITLE
ncbi:beta strand repeat-containing protein [Polaribacter sp.]|uniref:beta strand repeat-containing protein n=1 Tax=Polaribacter sp. TaxID=1920175 RepID=UPI004047BE14